MMHVLIRRTSACFPFAKQPSTFFFSLILLLYISPLAWHKTVDYFGAEREIVCSLVWTFGLSWSGSIVGVGFSLYSDFVIEEKHGFNKKTLKLFITDFFKSQAISIVMTGALIPALIWIVRWGGEFFYIYVWMFVQAVIFVMMFVYPNWIMPLFNKLEPLQDDDLKGKIEGLSKGVSFPLTKLYQMDGSKRSSHSNAFMFGFWKNKRIVIYDTLLKQCTHQQILAVLAHELGHWLHGHVTINLVISSVHIFVTFYLYGQVMYSKELFEAFFYTDTNAVIIGLMLFQYIYSPVETLLSLGMTMFSRRNEFQADENAVAMGYADELEVALKVISKENKGDLNPDPWFAWYHFSHPALIERLDGIKQQKVRYIEKKKTQ